LLSLAASLTLSTAAEPKFADPFLLTNKPGLFNVAPRPAEPPPLSPGATNPLLPDPAAASSGATAATNASAISMDALDDKYRLAVGDRLSFRIQEDEEDPKPLFVTDSGDLEVPYIGRFPALGKTCKELARALKAELEKEYYYQATVIVAVDIMTKSRGKVYLVGPVRMPGPQEIPSDEVLTLSKAILRAGGFNDYADRRNVKVTRKGTGPAGENRTFLVDVTAILEKGQTDTDLPLEPGDLIYIPERLIRF
jgi:polysaccharide biosynthesis/export protein